MVNVSFKEVYPGLESVLSLEGKCLGVVVKSCLFPFVKMFFCYEDCCCYHGMSSLEAYEASLYKEV